MRLLRGLHNPGLGNAGEVKQCVATIGNFDGVHVGHQAVIQQVVSEAKIRKLPAVVIIFEPQPLEFFKGRAAPARLMRFREKFQALSYFDIDYVFCLKFDTNLSQLSAEAFVRKVLVKHLNIAHLVVGDDFRFGGDRQGDFSLLVKEGENHGFTVENTSTILDQSEYRSNNHSNATPVRVSSSYVRKLLAKADFVSAEMALGRPYSMMGRVVHGQKLGRKLGFPTANIALQRIKSPLSGVYVVSLERCKLGKNKGVHVKGVANIGVKPTVGNFEPSLEVNLFDFNDNIYGENVEIFFHHKIRNEKRFEGLTELKAQIEQDTCDAKVFLAKT